jgi:hypothetical protein
MKQDNAAYRTFPSCPKTWPLPHTQQLNHQKTESEVQVATHRPARSAVESRADTITGASEQCGLTH